MRRRRSCAGASASDRARQGRLSVRLHVASTAKRGHGLVIRCRPASFAPIGPVSDRRSFPVTAPPVPRGGWFGKAAGGRDAALTRCPSADRTGAREAPRKAPGVGDRGGLGNADSGPPARRSGPGLRAHRREGIERDQHAGLPPRISRDTDSAMKRDVERRCDHPQWAIFGPLSPHQRFAPRVKGGAGVIVSIAGISVAWSALTPARPSGECGRRRLSGLASALPPARPPHNDAGRRRCSSFRASARW